MSTPGWESSKENAAPLERGRNVATLERAGLGLQNPRKSEQSIDQYESLVRPSEAPHVTEMDEDPLQHWLAYIKFYQESFPSDTHDQFLLMERCTRALIKMKQYADDDRFIGVCAKYADKTKDPMEVFKYLHQQKVGSHTALFWIAWAFVAERNNDFPFAEKIFKKGISKNAQPLQLLKSRHQQFQRRMSRHWLNNSQRNDTLDEEDEDATVRSRGVLGGIPHGLRTNERSASIRQLSRTFGARQSRDAARQNSSSNSTHALTIYVEEGNADDGYNLDQTHGRSRVIETQADRKKENTAEAERWNERGGLRSTRGTKQRSQSRGPPPAFPVFVDEECAVHHETEVAEKEVAAEHQRRVRDERTFRERGDEGMAERLARDPLRYVRDPSQLQSDIAAEEKDRVKADQQRITLASKSESRSRTGFSKRLLRNEHGEEQAFEEARARQKRFTLAAAENNFNLLQAIRADQSSQMDLDDDGSTDVSITDSERAAYFASDSSFRVQPRKLARVHSKTEGRALFSSQNSFEASLNHTAISTASSTVRDTDAVGVPTNKEEETINTKFAMRELSMMFSSPGFGADDAARKTEFDIHNQSNRSDSSFDNVVDCGDHHQLDNSVINMEATGTNENDGPCNAYGRSVSTPGFRDMALQELDSLPEGGRSLSCHSQIGRLSTPHQLSQEDPLRGREQDLRADAGFQVFEDEEATSSDNGRNAMRHDSQLYVGPSEAEAGAREATPQATGFAIFEDQGSQRSISPSVRGFHLQDDNAPIVPQPSSYQGHFSIFVDSAGSPNANVSTKSSPSLSVGSCLEIEFGDTATFSLFDDAVGMLHCDKSTSENQASPREATSQPRIRRSDGDTATISLFNEVFSEIVEVDTDQSHHSTRKREITPKENGGFDIFVDCDIPDENPSDTCLDDSTCKNSAAAIHHRWSLDRKKAKKSAIDYASIHERDSRVALRCLQASSLVPDSRISLQCLLSNVGHSFHLPHIVVPRVLRRRSAIPSKAEVCIGKHSGFVSNELGRGAYGVVVLLEADEASGNRTIAVKAQTSSSCLALEFVILRRLEERMQSRQITTYPFPQPLSFVSLSDGAIFSMTAASRSGLNLVDLVNVYSIKLGEPVPELIALHYTSRMLKHIETLHWHGKMLHCDVKPDNFVLCTLDCPGNNFCHIENSELLLVDFGRAVDLDQFSDQYDDVRNVEFHGNACGNDMMCVAMRSCMSWSFDIDTYGILAAAHVLLFGSHIEIKKGQDSEWRLRKQFQRYWQRELWGEIFHSLLNRDEASGGLIGSRAKSLRNLQDKIECHLDTEKGKLAALLTRQSNLLPSSRDKLE